MPSTALQIGRDVALLLSRARIFELAGLRDVRSCLFARWSEEFLTGHFDLVLLCHSLGEKERNAIAASVHLWNSAALVVLIDRHSGQVEAGMDAVLNCAPDRLVKDLPRLLAGK